MTGIVTERRRTLGAKLRAPVRYVGQYVAGLLGVVTLGFLWLLRPDGVVRNPVAIFNSQPGVPPPAPPVRARFVEHYTNVDPRDPLWVQYPDYVLATLGGDLGSSFYYARPMEAVVLDGLPTFLLPVAVGVLCYLARGAVVSPTDAARQRAVWYLLPAVVSLVWLVTTRSLFWGDIISLTTAVGHLDDPLVAGLIVATGTFLLTGWFALDLIDALPGLDRLRSESSM